MDHPQLSNIREHLGWLIGRRILDVTAGDPAVIPDSDPEDVWTIVLHLDNGGVLRVPIGEAGFSYDNPEGEPGEPGEPGEGGQP